MLNCESRISNMKKLSEHHGTCDCVCVCLCRVPFLMVGGLLISGERTDTIDSAFFYGRAQVRKTPAVILYFILFFYSVPFFIVFILDHLFPQLCLSLFSTYSVKEISAFTQ